MYIRISVNNKIAALQDDTLIINGNSDYVIKFEFDSEWDAYETKTARFVTARGYTDVVFSGDEVAVPVITDAISVRVGVYAGNLHTTTPAVIFCRRSITDGSGSPVDPTPDVYAQIMERLNNLDGATPATTDKLGVVKIGDNLKITNDGVLSVDTADAAEQDNTRPITSAAVYTAKSNIEALLGNLNDLSTEAKNNLVAAVNEVKQSGGGGGISTTAKNLLITILRSGVYTDDQSANITALDTALGGSGGGDSGETEKTLTSISTVYSGGSVPVGTAVSALTGIVVTAHYSDGSATTVTGYTLSGTIAEGENTVTVTYQGMTTTFAVTGVADTTGGDTGETLLYNWDFTQSLTDTVTGNVATLNGTSVATQDSNGVTMNTATGTDTSYVGFAANIFGANRRYEVDVVSVTSPVALNWFGRLFMLNGTQYKNCGFLFNKSKGGWELYNAKGWSHEVSTVATTLEYLNGKTLKVAINSDYTWDVYVGDELIVESASPMNCLPNDTDFSQCNIILGTNVGSNDSLGAVITGLRVYNMEVAG